MAEWNQRCREEAYKNMAGLPYCRIVQKNVAQLRAWHELLHAAAGRVQSTPEERQQQKRLRQDAIDNQVDLGERTLMRAPIVPLPPPPSGGLPTSMRLSFPAQASSVNITIAPRQEEAAPGMPPWFIPPAPRIVQQPPQQQGGRGSVNRSTCKGCWRPLAKHLRHLQHQKCEGNCITCGQPVQQHPKDTFGRGELMTGPACERSACERSGPEVPRG